MRACKKCKEIFGVFEMKNRICKNYMGEELFKEFEKESSYLTEGSRNV